MQVVLAPSFELFEVLRTELRTDVQALALRADMAQGKAPDGWTDVDGMLLYKGRLFVPDASTLWPQLLAQAHEAGHEGIQKKLTRWRSSFYNQHALRWVCDFLQGCAICQRKKSEHLHPAGLLQP